ncbi:hypothetical protein JRQ81_005216, partial [Phrynocephalus forsythii]
SASRRSLAAAAAAVLCCRCPRRLHGRRRRLPPLPSRPALPWRLSAPSGPAPRPMNGVAFCLVGIPPPRSPE